MSSCSPPQEPPDPDRLRALPGSAAFLRTLLDTLPDLVWFKDPDGVYLECNARFERCFGAEDGPSALARRARADVATERANAAGPCRFACCGSPSGRNFPPRARAAGLTARCRRSAR